jgi:hypothetical protein
MQDKLEAMLRRELAEQIIVQQEKSLDILAALLVYLGWSHFYCIPKRDSMLQFMWLAIAICEDLGLGLTQEEAVTRQFRHSLEHCDNGALELSSEAKRLYLGTYCLINTYSWSFAESSKVADWQHVVDCAERLAMENEYATDALVSGLVRMQDASFRFHTLFADFAMSENIDALQLSAQLDYADASLRKIKADLPQILQQSGEQILLLQNVNHADG